MSIADRIVARPGAAARAAELPRPLVFTNGVFDLLHVGHVDYLEAARALGGSLLVALNTDESARTLGKGADRPITPQGDRATVIAGLRSVSLVTFFAEPTPLELLHEVRPDLYVKGDDYDMDVLAETRFVRFYGGDARALPFRAGCSTTALVQRIRATAP